MAEARLALTHALHEYANVTNIRRCFAHCRRYLNAYEAEFSRHRDRERGVDEAEAVQVASNHPSLGSHGHPLRDCLDGGRAAKKIGWWRSGLHLYA